MIESAYPAGGLAFSNHFGALGVVTETLEAEGRMVMPVTGPGSGGASSNEMQAASGGVRGA